MKVEYLSCFSGIGGLEAKGTPPLCLCENDPIAADVLRKRYPSVEVWDDIETFTPPKAAVVAGGWPCQDISIAGRQAGLKGLRSRLLLELLRVSRESEAHTVVAENVTNLLKMRDGQEFGDSLAAFHDAGFPIVAWRVLNAREFGLPQHRARLLIIASRYDAVARSLFNPLPSFSANSSGDKGWAAGFYWTGGVHSINYSFGYVPTIKVGTSLGIPSPPAVHYAVEGKGVVRLLSPSESLSLQGFSTLVESDFPSASHVFKAVGNAVAQPMGNWVFDQIQNALNAGEIPLESDEIAPPELDGDQAVIALEDRRSAYPRAGVSLLGRVAPHRTVQGHLATDLVEYLDVESDARLSVRACRGLLARLQRSGQPCPAQLRRDLETLSSLSGGEGVEAHV